MWAFCTIFANAFADKSFLEMHQMAATSLLLCHVYGCYSPTIVHFLEQQWIQMAQDSTFCNGYLDGWHSGIPLYNADDFTLVRK
jgi:hypothetical protein